MRKIVNILSLIGLFQLAACAHKGHRTTAENNGTLIYSKSLRSPAAECLIDGPFKCKQARKSDWADQYALAENGDLFSLRKQDDGGILKCQVSDNVSSYKISMHPSDLAVVYYNKNSTLWVIGNLGGRGDLRCPSYRDFKKALMNNVADDSYNVVSNTNTTIVNVALDTAGAFLAWDNARVVYSDTGVEDYTMNTCYKSENKNYSSYVMFTLSKDKNVTKVRVNEVDTSVFDSSKETNETFQSLKEFKDKNNVCDEMNDNAGKKKKKK